MTDPVIKIEGGELREMNCRCLKCLKQRLSKRQTEELNKQGLDQEDIEGIR